MNKLIRFRAKPKMDNVMLLPKKEAEHDIKSGTFPVLSWSEEVAENSLNELHKYVASLCERSRQWYLVKKRIKKRFAYLLRLFAMILTAIAGIIPILAQPEGHGYFQWLPSYMASVVIAIAALLIAIDKFGDMSSGWVRYMLTAQKLSKIEQLFRFNWEKEKVAWKGNYPTPQQIKDSLDTLYTTVAEVERVVHEETRVWAADFFHSLHEIEKAANLVDKQEQVSEPKSKKNTGG